MIESQVVEMVRGQLFFQNNPVANVVTIHPAVLQVQLATNNAATMPIDYTFSNQLKADANNDNIFRWYGDLNGDGFTSNAEYFFSMLPTIGSGIGDASCREDLDANGDGFVTNFEAFFNFLPKIGTSRP